MSLDIDHLREKSDLIRKFYDSTISSVSESESEEDPYNDYK